MTRPSGPRAIGHLEQRSEAVRRGLVGPEHAEVAAFLVQPHDVAQERAEDPRGLGEPGGGLRHIDPEIAEVRHLEIAEEKATVRMRVGPHAP
jgi:hypothetical protein